ncbi:DNA polymerase lambda isoform X2 [Diospyros lotus]|uniref:DNA polymerase lambda isoform X2 n=1 Tax=Diospyros lotus TaxID=55363 RepID=UPI002257F163|nr:DNA polymerase lambda isoform X2 [Diospyros lotus]
MPPKSGKKRTPPSDPNGIFAGMVVFFVDVGVQPRRLQIWKHRLEQMGAAIEDRLSKKVTHVFATSSDAILQKIGRERLSQFKGSVLLYNWLEDSLTVGEKVSETPYILALESGVEALKEPAERTLPKADNGNDSGDLQKSKLKKIKTSPEDPNMTTKNMDNEHNKALHEVQTASDSDYSSPAESPVESSPTTPDALTHAVGTSDSALHYNPPNQNSNITGIFGKLVIIYRALGDDRRSFSYYKAIAVIEKLPYKIESVDQVKHLPAIGKSMQDHVRTISLFGEVWGIGPATALKLYEKGHRTLDDLKNDDSLTHAQRLGLKYFDDIRMRIPRHEAQEMELILKKTAEDILPGVVVVCGGSYRRGKASCGDLDIVITHPDGKSHRGFLWKYVKHLKDMKFLREDLVFSIHSEEGTDAGVDTYFGLCTYPGRELRHRIDFKVYARDIYAFGLIAWTGNDVLNRRLRLLAESKGYRLDDTGLFPATQSSGSKRGTKGSASLHFRTEKEVFEFLGFPWLEPHERNL